jgi:hypothetical protein
MQITVDIPEELVAVLAGSGQDLPRAVMEAIGLEAYRQGRLSGYQLRLLLGIPSRYELEGFLKEHEVYDYTVEDLEKDLANLSSRRKTRVDKSA